MMLRITGKNDRVRFIYILASRFLLTFTTAPRALGGLGGVVASTALSTSFPLLPVAPDNPSTLAPLRQDILSYPLARSYPVTRS